jgi:magnesium transporter
MRELIIADPDTTLDKVMLENVFSINAYAEQNDVVNELSKRGYFAAPVVDNQNHLIGIVKTSELMTQGRDSASEDIQKMFGAGGNERVFSSVRFSLFKRLPWLHINLVTAFLAGIVVSMFESTIAQIAVLAVFIPIITDQAANAGSQSLAVVMRGLVMHEVSRKNVYRLISKEVQLALMTGLIIAIVTGVVSWLWQGNPYLGVVIGISMIITLIVAGFTGALVPIIMRHYGLDPAQSSAIIVTTITDVVGIFVFLGFAVLFKNLLISG